MLYISCGLQHSRIKVGFLIFRSMLRICRYWVRTRSRSAVCQITFNKSSYSRFHFAATRTKHMSLRAENRIHAAVTGYPLSPNLGTGTTCVWGPGMDSMGTGELMDCCCGPLLPISDFLANSPSDTDSAPPVTQFTAHLPGAVVCKHCCWEMSVKYVTMECLVDG